MGEDLGLTMTNQLMGSPYYMSPEQFVSSRDVDERADIYSLGAALYELTTTYRPYHDKTTVFEIASAVAIGERPVPAASLVPDFPPTVAGILGCAMAREREARYQSVAEFIDDLQRYLAEESAELAGVTDFKGGKGTRSVVVLGTGQYAFEQRAAGTGPARAARRPGAKGKGPRHPTRPTLRNAAAALGAPAAAAARLAAPSPAASPAPEAPEVLPSSSALGAGALPAPRSRRGLFLGLAALVAVLLAAGVWLAVREVEAAAAQREKEAQARQAAAVAEAQREREERRRREQQRRDEFLERAKAKRDAEANAIAEGKRKLQADAERVAAAPPGPAVARAVALPGGDQGWILLTPAGRELAGWSVGWGTAETQAGGVRLNGGGRIASVQVRDGAVRAKVRKIAGQNLGLQIRKNASTGYIGWYNGGASFGIGVDAKGYRDLATGTAGRAYADGFTLTFAAKGTRLFLFADSELVVQTEHDALAEGAVGICAAGDALFLDVEYRQDWPDAAKPPSDRPRTTAAEMQAAFLAANPNYSGLGHKFIITNGQVEGAEMWNAAITDLSPLRGMPLKSLNCGFNQLVTLAPLQGMPLIYLCCGVNPITDLAPLKGMPLEDLECWANEISDLAPLKGMSLTRLICFYNQITDLSPLIGMPLKNLACGANKIRDLTPLKGMPLTTLECGGNQIADLSPLRGMPLTSLECGGNRITDLSPLKGMPLTTVECGGNPVADISPLKGMPLTHLGIQGLPLDRKNREVVRSFSLKSLTLDLSSASATELVRGISTLSEINGHKRDHVLRLLEELAKAQAGRPADLRKHATACGDFLFLAIPLALERQAAAELAQRQGACLASPSTEAKAQLLQQYLQGITAAETNTTYHFGLRLDQQNRTWVWDSGEKFGYTAWDQGRAWVAARAMNMGQAQLGLHGTAWWGGPKDAKLCFLLEWKAGATPARAAPPPPGAALTPEQLRALFAGAQPNLKTVSVFDKWPFDAVEAKRRQDVTAKQLGLPVALAVALPGGMKLELVLVPAGEFMMGSPEGELEREGGEVLHRVRLTRPFYLGKYEVTQAQWQAVMGNNPSAFKGADNPVEMVSWDDCQAFIAKLNAALNPEPRKVSGCFRLPTEAEWEYACRAGTKSPYAGNLDGMAWYSANSGNTTHPVGQKKANAWGLYDMHGNVWEWCANWHGGYAAEAVTDPSGATAGRDRVDRGGCWYGAARRCRAAYRDAFEPGGRDGRLGCRLVFSPVPGQ